MNPGAALAGLAALAAGAFLLLRPRTAAAAYTPVPAGGGGLFYQPPQPAPRTPGRPTPDAAGTPWNPPPLQWPRTLPTIDDLFRSGLTLDATPAAPLVQPVGWLPPEPTRTTAAAYIAQAQRTERSYGLPAGLLVRLLWQESRYQPNAYNAGSGALGIAQITAATGRGPGYGVPPIIDATGDHRTDPVRAIQWAGAYLAALKRAFGTWSAALAAYNWGPGNLSRLGIAAAPAETRAYVAEITRDTGVA